MTTEPETKNDLHAEEATSVICKAGARDTDGQFSLFVVHDAPGEGPPMHMHMREDESYLILEGTYEIHYADRETQTLSPGDFIRVPKGLVHTYWCDRSQPGKMIVMATPAGLEGFFADLGVLAGAPKPTEPPSIPEMVEIAARHGIQVVGPPAHAQ